MEDNYVVKIWKIMHGRALLWGSALFALVFLSLTAGAPSPRVVEHGPSEPVFSEMAFEWAITAPGGDISPHPGAWGGGLIDGDAVPAGLDVVTHYLQQMMLRGTEFSLRGPDGMPLGLTLIPRPVLEVAGEEEVPAAGAEPSPGSSPDPAVAGVAEARAPAEEEDPEPEPPGDDSAGQGAGDQPAAAPVEIPDGVIGFPVAGEVITGSGWVRCATLNEWLFHPGIDIRVDRGSEVRSALPGQVLDVINEASSGVTVTVATGDLVLVYGSLASAGVRPGDAVAESDVLGVIGDPPPRDAGLPPHLHWEVRDRAGAPLEMVVMTEGIQVRP